MSTMITASNPDACILIVDDEPRNVRVLKRVLAVAGYRKVTAITDPTDAIARFTEIEPDLLLLDLHMPEIDGLAVMERLRAGGRSQRERRTSSPSRSTCTKC
jgi:CheY-like chemotaxis protein